MRLLLRWLSRWTLNAHLAGVRLKDHTRGGQMIEDAEFGYMMLATARCIVTNSKAWARWSLIELLSLTDRAGVDSVCIVFWTTYRSIPCFPGSTWP